MEGTIVKVKKAIIPAAGYGTGFLPATKASSKELLPIVDKPIIQFIVEEAFASGIEEVLIITGKQKRAIEDHFDSNYELEANLLEKNKTDLLDIVQTTTKENLFFVRQSYPLGLGDAILHAKAFVGDEPFAVLLGDNITHSDIPVTKQLIDFYDKHKVSCVAGIEMEHFQADKYGIIEKGKPSSAGNDIFHVKSFVEKPSNDIIEKGLAIMGRYVLTPEIFPILENLETGVENEYQLTDAINELNQTQRVFVKAIDGEHFDVGNKLGYLEYSILYGLQHNETAEELKEYLKNFNLEK